MDFRHVYAITIGTIGEPCTNTSRCCTITSSGVFRISYRGAKFSLATNSYTKGKGKPCFYIFSYGKKRFVRPKGTWPDAPPPPKYATDHQPHATSARMSRIVPKEVEQGPTGMPLSRSFVWGAWKGVQ